jgi:hypothetical protein
MNTQDIKNYYEAIKTLDQISKEIKSVEDDFKAQDRALTRYYNEKISELETEQRTKYKALRALETKQHYAFKEKEEPLTATVKHTENLLEFMRTFISGDDQAPTPEVSYWTDRDEDGSYIIGKKKIFYSPVATLRNDKYNQVYLYIVKNKNKVNKFTLLMEGNCALDLFDRSRTIRKDIKDAPTEKELLGYMNRNMDKIKALLPDNLDTLTAEYESAVKLFKDVEWQKLYLEYRTNHYVHDYANGTSQPEYKDLTAIYSQIKKNPKDLVLLIGQLESDEGKNTLEKLLKG